jgi:hypothetical protein
MEVNMNRNKVSEIFSKDNLIEHNQRVAIHEAGHAAGIYLNNKAVGLPPVYFKIHFKNTCSVTEADVMAYQISHDERVTRVEGGRLIELLPASIDSLVHELTERNDAMPKSTPDYMRAFEADIINLLIGPLAEAKHVADTDDEQFNHKLVNLDALKNYGGSYDIALANEYLECLSEIKQLRDIKLDELFTSAFNFVNNGANWAAITKLADYMLGSSKSIICCEEISSMLDHSVAHFQDRKINARLHHR